jgi:hypothetical protein
MGTTVVRRHVIVAPPEGEHLIARHAEVLGVADHPRPTAVYRLADDGIGLLEVHRAPIFCMDENLDRNCFCIYINRMNAWDEKKRAKTLAERGLDFARADQVFDGVTVTMEDTRMDYGERRFITVGYLDGRAVVLIWTPRDGGKRIISMRKANEREIEKFAPNLG